MQAVTRHDVGLPAENAGRVFFHVHQFEEPELALLIVEKQIDVGTVAGVAARGRSEQIQPFDAELSKVGLMLLQSADDLVAFHRSGIAISGA